MPSPPPAASGSRLLRCPRCATVVQPAPGAAPVCPNCGFGSAPAPPAPLAAPAAGPRPPVPVPPAPSVPSGQYAQPSGHAAEAWPGPARGAPPARTSGLTTALLVMVPLLVAAAILNALTAPDTVTIDTTRPGFNVRDETNGPFGALNALLGLATVIVGLVWVARVHGAAKQRFGVQGSTAWAVWSWVIPFAHIVTPWFPMRRVWDGTRSGPPAHFLAWAILYGGSVAFSYILTIATFAYGVDIAMETEPGQVIEVDLPPGIRLAGLVGVVLYVAAAAAFLNAARRMDRAVRGA